MKAEQAEKGLEKNCSVVDKADDGYTNAEVALKFQALLTESYRVIF